MEVHIMPGIATAGRSTPPAPDQPLGGHRDNFPSV